MEPSAGGQGDLSRSQKQSLSLTRSRSSQEESAPSDTGLHSLKRMQVWEAVTNNVAFMLAPFLMPSLFVQTGWVCGLLFITFSNVVTYTTGLILGDICTTHPHLHSYPVLAEEAFRVIGRDWCHFDKIGQERTARGGRICVQVMQFVSYYLAGISELIYLMQYFSQLMKHTNVAGHEMCQFDWLLVSAVCSWPFMQIPDFHESRWSAVGTNLLVAFGAAVAFYEILLVAPWTCEPGPEYPPVTFGTVMVGLTGVAYAYGGHGLYPETIREMEDSSRWPTVMRWTYFTVTPLYVVLGCLGYYAYGGHARANINANFPANRVNTLAIVALLIGEFYYVYFSVLVVMLQVEFALGVDPTSWCRHKRLVIPEATEAQGAGEASPDPDVQDLPEIEEESAWREWLSLRRLHVPPVGFRLIFRTLFLGSMVLIAASLLGGDGDLLLSIQALSGAIGFVMMTYVLPLLFGWVLLPRTQKWTLAYHVSSFVMGLLVFFVGTVFAIKDVVSKAGAFGGSNVSCHYYGYDYYSGGSHYGCKAALGKQDAANSSALAVLLS